ncbi:MULTISPECIES: hypothetical protein [unclassified Variovorax]|uniref:hypothetical protein n=1 Tax=unclassified Variovorax TaxID=663243 RepID=UPI003F4727EA
MQAARTRGFSAPGFGKLRSDVSAAGESFLSVFDPATLQALLLDTGLRLKEDLDGHRAIERYDPAGLNSLRSAGAAHMAHAVSFRSAGA